MGAGVGPAEHHAGVLPHFHPGPPPLVAATQGRSERREYDIEGERVDEDDVEEDVDDVSTPNRGDLAERPSPPGGPGIADLHEGEVIQDPERPFGSPFRPLRAGVPWRRVGHGGAPGGGVTPDDLAPPRQPGQQRRGSHPHEVGKREGDHVGPLLGRHVRGPELLLEYLLGGQAAEKVPVQRTVSSQGHLRHQLHAGVGNRSHGRDELERRARMASQRPRQCHELLEGGRTRRDGPTIAVRVALAEGGGEPERAVGQRRPDQLDHGGQLLRTRLGPGGVVTHDGTAHGGMPHHESGVHRQAPVDPRQVLGEGRPVPVPRRPSALSGIPSTTAIMRRM